MGGKKFRQIHIKKYSSPLKKKFSLKKKIGGKNLTNSHLKKYFPLGKIHTLVTNNNESLYGNLKKLLTPVKMTSLIELNNTSYLFNN